MTCFLRQKDYVKKSKTQWANLSTKKRCAYKGTTDEKKYNKRLTSPGTQHQSVRLLARKVVNDQQKKMGVKKETWKVEETMQFSFLMVCCPSSPDKKHQYKYFTAQTHMALGGRYILVDENACMNMRCRIMSTLCNMTEHGTAKFDDGEIETNWA